MKFLHGCARPTVALLYQDTKETRHVKTYEVNLKDKEFVDGPWSLSNVEGGSSMLIAVPKPLGKYWLNFDINFTILIGLKAVLLLSVNRLSLITAARTSNRLP
jgi:hypothetical protein